MSALVWPRSLFRAGDAPEQPCPPVIDITGALRILTFGPGVMVPPGLWRLTARFDLSTDAARYPFLLQFGEGASLAELTHVPVGPGTQYATMENRLAGAEPAELRLWLALPAFHGDLEFHSAMLESLESGADNKQGRKK